MLAIKDLSVNKELDRNAMSEVRGGMGMGYVPDASSIYESIYTDYDYTEKWNLQDSVTSQTNNLVQDGSTVQFATGQGNLNVAGGSFMFGAQFNQSHTQNG